MSINWNYYQEMRRMHSAGYAGYIDRAIVVSKILHNYGEADIHDTKKQKLLSELYISEIRNNEIKTVAETSEHLAGQRCE